MPARLRSLATDELRPAEIEAIRVILDRAFGSDPDEAFTQDDWDHALGGRHFIQDLDGAIVAHAAVVERELRIGGRALRTGYVEAVAVDPSAQGRGHGTAVMRAADPWIEEGFELGALGTGSFHFYERLGWRRWRGPSAVWTPAGDQPTPDDDGYIMVLVTPRSPALDLDLPISCPWRPGDAW